MAARDRYTINLKCPKCGRAGLAEVSEDDYPFMKDPRFSVDHLAEGFVVQKLGKNYMETDIICQTCKVVATKR